LIALEKTINHIHIYDVFANCSDNVEDTVYENIGKLLQFFWSNYLRSKFPLKTIIVEYNNGTQVYGPTITFKSEQVIVKIVHNTLENSNALYAAKDARFLFPVDEKLIKTVFGAKVKIDFVPPVTFVNNLTDFFTHEGRSLLTGDNNVLKAIEEYVYAISKRYTDELVNKQHLDAADKAWKEGDYSTFVHYLDKTNRAELSSAYALKYKMALDKLNKH
jgi:hypothetical protein